MTIYNTASITPELRDMIPNGTHQFDRCEDCDNRNYEAYMGIKYYLRYKRALCDAYVDCRDGLKWRDKKDYSQQQQGR